MVLFFVKGAQSFCVNQNNRSFFVWIVGRVEDLLEQPKTFSAGVDCGPH